MASPFPGMDPYLESNEYWRGFHHHFAEEMARQLNPLIVPKYFADVEVKTVLEELNITEISKIYPDAAILEIAPQKSLAPSAVATVEAPIQRVVTLPGQTRLRTIHVYITETKKLVTSIEILSPVNKHGDGLKKYREKREHVFRSAVHLIELDLLRGGQRPGRELHEPPLETDYVILVNRAKGNISRISEIWPVGLNESLPTIPVPLLSPDPDVLLDLAAIFKNVYDIYYYELHVDYQQPVPSPPLRPTIQAWLAEHLPQIGHAK